MTKRTTPFAKESRGMSLRAKAVAFGGAGEVPEVTNGSSEAKLTLMRRNDIVEVR
jgi:hypothetical protein